MTKLNKKTVAWARDILSNDETSTDLEMTQFFMKEGKMDQESAERFVNVRSLYLNKIVMNNGSVFTPSL
jgi:hypothetical protein